MLGRYFKSIRKAKRITLRKLTVPNGIDAGNYSKVECELTQPSVKMLSQICEALDLTEEEISLVVEMKATEQTMKLLTDIHGVKAKLNSKSKRKSKEATNEK